MFRPVCARWFPTQTVLLIFLGVVMLVNSSFADERPRVVVMTDFFKDPDDMQSLIRFLTSANEFNVEGLIATSLAYGDGSVHPEWIRDVIDEYAIVLPNLRLHERPGYEYPDVESLKSVVKAGAPVIRKFVGKTRGFSVPFPQGAKDSRMCEPAEKWIGAGKETDASRHLIEVVDRTDDRPVWVVVWGGAMDLAQAVWTVRDQRTATEFAAFIDKLRVYQVSWQDTGAVWLWENCPDLFLIQSTDVHSGLYRDGDPQLRDETWVDTHVRRDHGPLGELYPQANPKGVKEGDSPSFLYLLATGLSDPEHPEWGSWGGRFQRLDSRKNFFVDAGDRYQDSGRNEATASWTIGRWNESISHEFAARMDWCIESFDEANHPPDVSLNGDTTTNILFQKVSPGESASLSANGTQDRDGDSLAYRWWQYREAGTSESEIRISDSETSTASVIMPNVADGETFHVIFSVTDNGTPPLTSYRRMVLQTSETPRD